LIIWGLGIEDGDLGIENWGLGPTPAPQSPIPNPQSPNIMKYFEKFFNVFLN